MALDYILHLLIFVQLYIMLAQSLNLILSYGDMVSLAHAGFYGVGAYSGVLLSVEYGLGFPLSLAGAALIGASIAFLSSSLIARLVEEYFVIATIAIQVILFSFMNNLNDLTNGPLGISVNQQIAILGFELSSKASILALLFAIMIIHYVIYSRVAAAPFGKKLLVINTDEVYAKSIGINVSSVKVSAFVISSISASIAGTVFAYYVSYIDPSSFTINESIAILTIAIMGGYKRSYYIIPATVFIVVLPELLRYIELKDSYASNIKNMIYGGLLYATIFINNKTTQA